MRLPELTCCSRERAGSQLEDWHRHGRNARQHHLHLHSWRADMVFWFRRWCLLPLRSLERCLIFGQAAGWAPALAAIVSLRGSTLPAKGSACCSRRWSQAEAAVASHVMAVEHVPWAMARGGPPPLGTPSRQRDLGVNRLATPALADSRSHIPAWAPAGQRWPHGDRWQVATSLPVADGASEETS